MASLGRLAVAIGADTAEFDAAMGRTQSRMSSFASGARNVLTTVAKYGPVMAAAGAAIITKFTSAQMGAIDASAKLARQLGTTTASIATMERAAQLAGVDNMRDSMDQLNRRLSEAIGGTGRAAEAMDKLGLSARELQRLPIDERMQRISQAMRENVDVTEQASLMNDLFGRSGGQMIEVMRDFDGVVGTARQQAEAFGTAVSDVDAASIERANDAMSAISVVLQGVFRRIAVQVAPIVEHLAQLFVDTAVETRGWEQQLNRSMDFAQRAIGFVADGINGLRVGFQAATVAGNAFRAAMLVVADMVAKAFNTVVQNIVSNLRGLIETANKLPLVNIPLDGLDAFGAGLDSVSAQITQWSEDAKTDLEGALEAFRQSAMQEVPSEAIQRFFDEAMEASRKASEEIQRNRREMLGMDADGGGDDAEIELMRKQQEERLEALRESLLSEREAEMEHHAERLAMLEEIRGTELEQQFNLNELMEREEQRHHDRLKDIAAKGAKAKTDETLKQGERELRERQQQMQALQTGVSNILGSMAQENKAFGIAQAIINTWRGVSESLAAYPFPVSAVMAAASLAAGLQTVRNIQGASTKGGGGGAGGAIAGGGAAASAPAQAQQARPQQEASRTATVNIRGDVFSREGVMGLMDQMNELMADGYSGVTFA